MVPCMITTLAVSSPCLLSRMPPAMTNGATDVPPPPAAAAAPPPPRRPLQHSFHVLTDGSEYTGQYASVFLTVHPTATSVIKYALSGLPESLARLAADQKFPLHCARAVFVPTTTNLDGLASLLLTLQQAGAEQLTVCGAMGTCRVVESVTNMILPKTTTHPKVRTCQVVSNSNEWFQIYNDDYLVVHAKSVKNMCGETDASSIVLVYTVVLGTTRQSFAILPPECDASFTSPLPAFCGENDVLDFVVLLNALHPPPPTTTKISTKLLARTILTTAPPRHMNPTNPMDNNTTTTTTTNGLFIRAKYHCQQRHCQCPFLYPYNCFGDEGEPDSREDSKEGPPSDNSPTKQVVTTCSTWRLGDDTVDRDSYKRGIWKRCRDNQDRDEKEDATICAASLSREIFHDADDAIDENEIDLEERNEIPAVPHLLVLGTGCASPSPLRGSSGYALFLPTRSNQVELQVVVECGEGFVASLQRHLPPTLTLDEQLCHIQLIWISHAHLDHYGGLPCLLRERQRACEMTFGCDDNNNNNKRQRFNPPTVVAPRKVLRYLQVMLSNQPYYEGLTHAEWKTQALHRPFHMPSSFQTLQSVPVEHCPSAHALLLGWRNNGSNNNNDADDSVLFCYSGDCRPSLNFVHAAKQQQQQQQRKHVLTLLLHEATFNDEHADMAHSKRHCTVSEALKVASDIQPDATLLTHFSQRYPKTFKSNNNGDDDMNVNYCICQDGLWLPLTKKALSNVYRLKIE